MPALTVLPLEIGLLQMRRIFENQVGNVHGRRRGVDRSVISRTCEQRQAARVIEMGVRQDNCIELSERAFFRNMIVIVELPGALEQPAVDENIRLSRLHEVTGSCDFTSSGAMNGDSHFQLSMNRVSLTVRIPRLILRATDTLKVANISQRTVFGFRKEPFDRPVEKLQLLLQQRDPFPGKAPLPDREIQEQ